MTIVAHQDDDILFMNPDIDASIAAGEPNTTIYITAGDAGLGRAYWEARELGAKAAYSEMTGIANWVDETVELDIGGTPFEIATAHPEGNTDVRLYFLRLPDGGGDLPPGLEQQLARLESGALETVASQDGVNSYEREDLVEVLQSLMELHTPSQFRLQIHEGPNAAGEHTDHIETSQFSDAALAAYDGENYTVTRYVNYASEDMPFNLSPEEAARSFEIMEAYTAFDSGALGPDGNIIPVYARYTVRQYIDSEVYVGEGGVPSTDDGSTGDGSTGDGSTGDGGTDTPPDTPSDALYAMSGPDSVLFDIDPLSGEIAPKQWFSPMIGDPWDVNGDHVYEVARVTLSDDGTPSGEEALYFETVAEGVLALGDGVPPTFETPGDSVDPDAPADPQEPSDPEPPTDPETPAAPDTPWALDIPLVSGGTVFSLAGPDFFLFEIDATTGEITTKDGFTPSLDDAQDRNGDNVYEVTRVANPADGPIVLESLRLETTADGVLTAMDGTTVGGDAPPLDDTPDDTADDTPDDTPDGSVGDGSDPVAPPASEGPWTYALSGPDALLFQIDAETGDVAFRDWFEPEADHAWDRDKDFVYEITRDARPPDDGAVQSEDLRFQALPNGTFVETAQGGGLVELISLPEDLDAPYETAEAEEFDAVDLI